MLETTFPKKLCRPLLALGLACAVGGFVAAGCVDNSGNKTYPRGDSGTRRRRRTTSRSPTTREPVTTLPPPMRRPRTRRPPTSRLTDGAAERRGRASTFRCRRTRGLDVTLDTGTGG